MKYLKLIRIQQWYKNLVVFLALFFSGNIFSVDLLGKTVIAFFTLCLISSAGYIINDLIDLKKDKLHPEKKNRPLASGRINKFLAIFIAVVIFIFGIIISLNLSTYFLYSVLLLFSLTQIYSFFLKKIVFADVLTIATLFVIRAISGAFVIDVVISPWLILVPFFLALFLAIGKRHAELHLDKASESREVLLHYNKSLTNSLMIISTTLLILSYSLYSFLSEFNNLLYSLPFSLFVIFRFYYLIEKGSMIARHPEKVMKDRAMVIGMLLWLAAAVLLIYL